MATIRFLSEPERHRKEVYLSMPSVLYTKAKKDKESSIKTNRNQRSHQEIECLHQLCQGQSARIKKERPNLSQYSTILLVGAFLVLQKFIDLSPIVICLRNNTSKFTKFSWESIRNLHSKDNFRLIFGIFLYR